MSRTVTAVPYHFTLIDRIMEIRLVRPGVGVSCGYEYHLGHVSRNCYTSDSIISAQEYLSESSQIENSSILHITNKSCYIVHGAIY